MKKFLLVLLVLFNIGFCDSVLIIKEGWQLIGVSEDINDMSVFKVENVEQVWHFDASSQKWLAYSPDSKTEQKMKNLNIAQISKLKNWHGFWVKSKKDWEFISKSSNPTQSDEERDKIELKKGWNLISLPIDIVVSPKIFGDMIVWKYDKKNQLELFSKVENTKFPKLESIGKNDGVWVKADEDKVISIVEESAKLNNFQSKKEMEEFLKDMIYNQTIDYNIMPLGIVKDAPLAPDVAVPTTVAQSTSGKESQIVDNYTNTNLQEIDVDESDIIKHNGDTIFYIIKSNNQSKIGDKVAINSFTRISQNNTKPINEILVDNNKSVDSIYLVDKKLVVVSNFNNYFYNKIYYKYQNLSGKVFVDIYDVTDINNIAMVSNFVVDGYLNTSRVVESNLFLVTNFTPSFKITYPKIYVNASQCKTNFDYSCHFLAQDENGNFFKYDYQNYTTSITKLTPQITINGQESELLEPSKLYASSKKNQKITITTISKIDIKESSYKDSSSIVGFVSGYYASSKSFYLVSSEFPFYFDFYNYKQRSFIYKFNLEGEFGYSSYGFVDGSILNQFSLSEYQNILRIATTEGFSWNSLNTVNKIYTLKKENNLLSIQGVLSGLGKDGETIRSVRFMGDKAYVVSFKQTDPFYTIDLSNPFLPIKVGELKVNGYSGYLHLVDKNRVLGIGRDANSDGVVEGLKMELFDISDFANPISIDSKIIGDKFVYSELENDHKALSFRNSDKLFAFPYNSYSYNDGNIGNFLGIYDVKMDKINAYKPLQSTIKEYNYGKQRGLIFDINNVTFIAYFVNGNINISTLNNLK